MPTGCRGRSNQQLGGGGEAVWGRQAALDFGAEAGVPLGPWLLPGGGAQPPCPLQQPPDRREGPGWEHSSRLGLAVRVGESWASTVTPGSGTRLDPEQCRSCAKPGTGSSHSTMPRCGAETPGPSLIPMWVHVRLRVYACVRVCPRVSTCAHVHGAAGDRQGCGTWGGGAGMGVVWGGGGSSFLTSGFSL